MSDEPARPMSIKERIAAMNLTKEKRVSASENSPKGRTASGSGLGMKKRFTLNHVDPAGKRVPAPICPEPKLSPPAAEKSEAAKSVGMAKKRFTLVSRMQRSLGGRVNWGGWTEVLESNATYFLPPHRITTSLPPPLVRAIVHLP